jgi:sulfur-oxidizing protein SoxX
MKPLTNGGAAALLGSTALVYCAVALGPGSSAWASEKYYEWQVTELEIKEPLGGLKGDPDRGRELAKNRKKGNCLACHQMPIPEEDFHGTIAPPLTGVGARYDEGQLRLRVVDIKQINPMSLMPSFYKDPSTLSRVSKKFQGKTVLSAQEVEDVIAYLNTLK